MQRHSDFGNDMNSTGTSLLTTTTNQNQQRQNASHSRLHLKSKGQERKMSLDRVVFPILKEICPLELSIIY